jgi:predicted DNA-binding transcriptional regulator AlpA
MYTLTPLLFSGIVRKRARPTVPGSTRKELGRRRCRNRLPLNHISVKVMNRGDRMVTQVRNSDDAARNKGSERLLDLKEVLERVRMGQTALYKRLSSGRFPMPVRHGRHNLWPESVVNRWISDLRPIDRTELASELMSKRRKARRSAVSGASDAA